MEPLTGSREYVASPPRRPSLWLLASVAFASVAVGCFIGLRLHMSYEVPPSSRELQATSNPFLRPGLPAAYQNSKFGVASIPSVYVTRVNAQVLIPGKGEPITGGCVIFNDANQILFAGSQASLPPGLEVNATFSVEAVMPGMWDCHTHFAGPFKLEDEPFKVDGPFSSGAYPLNYIRFQAAVEELNQALMKGITSVRELGGPFGQPLRELLRTGKIQGPNFHYAGRAIGMTSGHTDEQDIPLQVFRWMDEARLTLGTLCDGVAECLKRTRENLRMQADVIKIMTSGGVLSEFDQPTDAELSLDEIRAITEDAKRAKRAVAAHAHSSLGIRNAIVGGVTTIEHGTWMDETRADMILQQDYMVYTPTLTIVQELFNGTSRPSTLDDNQWRKGLATMVQHSKAVRMAIAKGVPIVAGTDCPNGCSEVGKEVNYLHMFGMTALQAIQAATGDAPRCMGAWGLAPKSGRLAEGYEADIIGLDVSPLVDLQALTRAGNITHVWKSGRLVKPSIAK